MELRWLAGRVRRGASCALHAEAGIGKTTLLQAAAAASGRPVFHGGGLATLGFMSHLPLIRALSSDPPPGDAARVAEWVRDMVGPGVLVLDDLHWADAETFAVLPLLTPHVNLLAGVRRGGPAEAAALAALEESGVEVRRLAPLSAASARRLARARRPDVRGDALTRLLAHAAGNPLLLLELPTDGRPTGLLRARLAETMRAATSDARRGLQLLAVAERPLPLRIAGEGVLELLSQGIVVRERDEVGLRHPLLGDAVLEGIAVRERRRLHLALADALPDGGEAARHNAAGGRPARARDQALRAAAGAARPVERARHLALAARLSRGASADDLRLRAAEALTATGLLADAVEVLDAVLGSGEEVQCRLALARASLAYERMATVECRDHVRRGLALVGAPGTEVEARLRLVAARAAATDFEAGEDHAMLARDAMKAARAAGLPEAPFLEALGWSEMRMFAYPAAKRHFSAAARLVEDDPYTSAWIQWGLVNCALGVGQRAVATRLVGAARRAAHDSGLGLMVGLCDLQEAQLAVFRGDTVEAVEKLTEIGAVPREGEPIVTMVRAIALADLARDREAWAALTGAPEPVAPAFAELHHYARGEVLMCGGRPAEALAAFSAAACSGAVFLQETGELPAARAWAELEAGSPVTVLETPPSRALVRLASSVQTQAIDALAGARHEEAEALFGEAAAIWRRLFRREEHRCLWGACEAMRRMGDDARARDGLLRLERSAVRCGYVALTRRIHQTLRLIGERRSAPRTRTGVLTGRQRETLQLVAEGLTTPAIARRLGVSRHTVDSQIASAMMKLGARTRRQAALMSAGLAPG